MAKQMLFLHWRTVRWGLVPFVLASFALPLLSVRWVVNADMGSSTLRGLLSDATVWLSLYPSLATAIGIVLALSAWHWDHRGNHVYALSLPVSRSRYTTLKFGAGIVLGLAPVAALLAGSFVALASVSLPDGLTAYPLQLAGRFLFTILVPYAMVFALAAGTVRTTIIVLSVLIGIPMVTLLGLDLLGTSLPVDIAWWVENLAWEFGPFRILAGNWMLIDV